MFINFVNYLLLLKVFPFFRSAKVLLNLKVLKNKVLIIPKKLITISFIIDYTIQKMCVFCFSPLQKSSLTSVKPKNQPRREWRG